MLPDGHPVREFFAHLAVSEFMKAQKQKSKGGFRLSKELRDFAGFGAEFLSAMGKSVQSLCVRCDGETAQVRYEDSLYEYRVPLTKSIIREDY